MAISTQIQNLNLIPGKSAPVVVHLSQGNVGNTVQFYLYDGDNPYYPTNVSIAVHGVRADNTVFGPYTVSVTSGSNLVSFDIVSAMTSVTGAAIGELVLTDNSQNQIGSANFGMLIEETPYSSSVTYEDDLSIYQRILAYVQSFPASVTSQISAEASARQAATDAIQSQLDTETSDIRSTLNTTKTDLQTMISSEASTRASADTNLQNQINQITSPSGEAPSAAEVQNARIGADGVTYSTLGDAIRTQVGRLNNETLQLLIEAATPYTTIENGVYNKSSKQIDTPLSSTRHITVDVTEGEFVAVYGYYYNASYPLWLLFDSSDNIVSSSLWNTSGAGSEQFIVPAGVTKLIVNCSTNAPGYQKVYKSSTIRSFDEISEYVNAINRQLIDSSATAATSQGSIEAGCYNVSTHEIVSPLASTRHIEVAVNPYEVWHVAGYMYNASFPLWVLFDSDDNIVQIYPGNPPSGAYTDTITIPEGVTKLIVNCSTNTPTNYAKTLRALAANAVVNTNIGKKYVWLGTSIPAGAKYGLNNQSSYPMIVGKKIGATVINEAVGESSVHCKKLQRIDATYNPYGFVANWEKCARCLTNTVEEVNWLIAHYNDKDGSGNYIFTQNRPSSITSDDETFYRSCSYEQKIKSHLDAGDIDTWVFDHGHNDNQYDDNVVNGATLTDEQVIQQYGKNNLYTWEGACNFIFTYILNADNKARIIMIGEYDNRLADVPPHQMEVSESWEIPLFKLWEVIGWNVNHTITTTGFWDNSTGLWVESGGTEQTITIHDRFVRDHIHPSSDSSGYATEHIAKLIAKWLVNMSYVE